MRILNLSLTIIGLSSLLGAGSLDAQAGGGTSAFKWYVGGHGGITSFRTTTTGREFVPMGGGHLLITAKRTGLLLSVDQGFGPTQSAISDFQVLDSLDNIVNAGTLGWTFKGIRRYSAMLLAYPVRNQNIQPYLGVGVGIAHTTALRPPEGWSSESARSAPSASTRSPRSRGFNGWTTCCREPW